MEGTRLQKLFEELLDNAFRYSTAGSPVRVVSMPNENELIVYVIDNGRGMTAEQISSIGAYVQFERNFYEQQGTGLGLSIAKRLTELYGGKLSIESVPKVKTIVRLALPRVLPV
jgi:signal transduction histidine kinase